VRVHVLGAFEVEGVSERGLGSRKGRTLLKLLVLARGRPVPLGRTCDVLWGDHPPSRPADDVSVLVSRLRGVLGPDRIRRTDDGYALVVDWLDVDELAHLAETAADALDGGRTGVARVAARTALELARGPLLGDEDGAWLEADRAAADAIVRRVRRLSVDSAMAAGDYDGAAAAAEQAIAADPYDEAVLRALMRAHLAARRPASALAAYVRVRHRLAEDLGVPPTMETEGLHATALAAADGDGGGSDGGGSDGGGSDGRGSDGRGSDGSSGGDGGDPAQAGAGVPRAPTRLVARLVGRAAEVAVLDAALAEARTGGVVVVTVEGDAGIGKTTLVEWWAATVDHDVVVLRGRCDALGRELPLQPVVDAVADHLRVVGAEHAAALLGDGATALAAVLGPVAGTAHTIVADAEAGRARLFAALLGVLVRAGHGGLVALVIDDLHLAGAGTIAWLRFVQHRAHRLLVVVTTRPGGARAVHAQHHVRLGPLDLGSVTDLVGAARAAALYERSGGHPLLLSALAAAPDDDLPATLNDAVAAEIDSLGSAVAATVRFAAVLGPDFDLDLLAQVSKLPVLDLLSHLEAAEAAGVMVERGNRFAFRHELVREAVEARAGAARRAFVHSQAARALAVRAHPDPLAVAAHATAGGDTDLAAQWFLNAAVVAAGRFDTAAAEKHLTRSLELAPTAAAHGARARLHIVSGHLEAAATDASQAVARGGGAAALETAGWVAYYRRRYDEARAFADEAAARADDDEVRTSALALAGRVRHGAGDLTGATDRLTAVAGGSPSVHGVASVWLGGVWLHRGRPVDALAALTGPMVAPDELAHPFAPLHLRFYRVMALGQLGRITPALEVARDLDGVVGRVGQVGVRFAGVVANTSAWILRWSGRAEEADDRNREAYELTGGDRGPAADAMAEAHYVALLDLADGALLRGDLATAAALAERLAPVDTWTGTMAWHQRHRLGLLRARVALADDDPDSAAQHASAVAADAGERGADRYEALARATAALADPSISVASLAPVVDCLGRCAVLDGWPVIVRLAESRRVDRWRSVAEGLAASMVASAGDHRSTAARFAEGLLANA
jgi:DNA-binding SARP family transcriptional activator